jgi:hypothetical protein
MALMPSPTFVGEPAKSAILTRDVPECGGGRIRNKPPATGRNATGGMRKITHRLRFRLQVVRPADR